MLSHQIPLCSNLFTITPVQRSGHEDLATSSATNLSLLLKICEAQLSEELNVFPRSSDQASGFGLQESAQRETFPPASCRTGRASVCVSLCAKQRTTAAAGAAGSCRGWAIPVPELSDQRPRPCPGRPRHRGHRERGSRGRRGSGGFRDAPGQAHGPGGSSEGFSCLLRFSFEVSQVVSTQSDFTTERSARRSRRGGRPVTPPPHPPRRPPERSRTLRARSAPAPRLPLGPEGARLTCGVPAGRAAQQHQQQQEEEEQAAAGARHRPPRRAGCAERPRCRARWARRARAPRPPLRPIGRPARVTCCQEESGPRGWGEAGPARRERGKGSGERKRESEGEGKRRGGREKKRTSKGEKKKGGKKKKVENMRKN